MSAAPDQQPPVKGPGGGTPPRQDETDLWMLVHEHGVRPRDGARIMGMHHKRLWYLCEKWARQRKYDYGVSCDLGWSVARMGRNHYVTAASITTGSVTAVQVYPKPPPPPFSGASMAMQVVMAGREIDPTLREANRRAVASVRRRARADAQRIVVRDVRPAPRSTRATPGVMLSELLRSGQVFVQHGHVTRPAVHQPVPNIIEGFQTPPVPPGSRRWLASPHFTVHDDGQIVQNVPLTGLSRLRATMGHPW